jgi:hypothetical protein
MFPSQRPTFIVHILISSLIVGLLSLMAPVQGNEGQGVPIGVPSAVPTVTVATPVTSDTATISWQAPASNGGSDITGYSAVALTGASFDVRTSSTCSVPAGTLTCTLFSLNFGSTYKVEVVAINSVGASSPTLSDAFTIDAVPQTVTITGAPISVTYGDLGSQLSASATSNLPVTWSSLTSNCNVDNTGRVTYSAIGTCSILALQDGSGSIYAAESATVSIEVELNLSASATGASAISGNSALLNGSVPFSGSDASVTFCIATVNSNATCSTPSGVTIGTSSPTLSTALSGNAFSANVSGLSAAANYFYWVEARVGAITVKSSTSSFATLSAPVLARSGPTTGQVNSAFSTTISASGGSGVYLNWGVSSLPVGLILSPSGSTATITGTPTSAGTSTAVVTVTDSNDVSTSLPVVITIVAPPEEADPEEEEFDTTREPRERIVTPPTTPLPVVIPEVLDLVIEQGNVQPSRPSAGDYVFLRDSAPSDITFRIIEERILSFTGPDVTLNMEIRNARNQIRVLLESRIPAARLGDFLSITGFGFIPSSKVSVWLYSTPTLLGRIEATPLRSIQGVLPIPQNFPLGRHTLQINGVSTNGEVISLSLGIEVLQALNEPSSESDAPRVDETPSEKISITKVVRPVFLRQGVATVDKKERSRIKRAKKFLADASLLVGIRCVAYTPKKKTTKLQRREARERAKNVCIRLVGKKEITFQTRIRVIKKAPPVKRKSSLQRPLRVDIIIRRSLP